MHDVGGSIIPHAGGARARPRSTTSPPTSVPGATERDRGYWRDVGTLDAFYDAHMDLISVSPIFNLYNMEWPILTMPEPLPPAKFVFAEDERMGHALDSMVSLRRDRLGRDDRPLGDLLARAPARAARWSTDSVLFSGVDVGGGAIVRRAIIDKDVVIEPGRADRRRPRRRPRALHGLRRRGRRGARRGPASPRARAREPPAGRAAHPRVPARGLRRRRGARRVSRRASCASWST